MTTPCPCISYFCIPLSILLSTPSLSLFFCLSLSYIAIFLYFCNYITFILSICLSLSLYLLYPGHSIFLWVSGQFSDSLYFPTNWTNTASSSFMVIDISTINIQRQHNISKITPPYWAVFRFFIFSNPLDEHSILFSWLLTYRHHRQQNIWLFKYMYNV